MPNQPIIPAYITVHLGSPDSNAENVTVPFVDYIKNVASSEIFPTWPDSALRANIYAQISYALNRYYTQYYRARGYNFDITNSIAIDQSFVYGRDYFENISEIVDELFNDYIVKGGGIEPYFTAYCDGEEIRCDGLEQWGTVDLANQGYTPLEILQYYYGDDISIVKNAPVENVSQPLPERDLTLGAIGNDVQQVQIRLNRISKNYPSIPKVYPVDGVYDQGTENAVKEFQRVFNLTPDGIVGKATWYSIQRVYSAVKKLNDLESEGISLDEISNLFLIDLEEGDTGSEVFELQYLLALIGDYNEELPRITPDGIYGANTKDAVLAFQRSYGLNETGTVGFATWDQLYKAYLGILESLPEGYFDSSTMPYPGYVLRAGSSGPAVTALQEYLNYIGNTYSEIPKLTVDGSYGPSTENAVRVYEGLKGFNQSGIVSSRLWNAITSDYRDLYDGSRGSLRQYPGFAVE
ncbi:MAG: peptidoglycan-binding protein [Clostridia bacterium]|nr:peptidoglycan-binding protein [Clostridia bacterium]